MGTSYNEFSFRFIYFLLWLAITLKYIKRCSHFFPYKERFSRLLMFANFMRRSCALPSHCYKANNENFSWKICKLWSSNAIKVNRTFVILVIVCVWVFRIRMILWEWTSEGKKLSASKDLLFISVCSLYSALRSLCVYILTEHL